MQTHPVLTSISVSGEHVEGARLTCEYDYMGGVEGDTMLQWLRIEGVETEEIEDAQSDLYKLSVHDVGKTISCRVTPTRNDGASPARCTRRLARRVYVHPRFRESCWEANAARGGGRRRQGRAGGGAAACGRRRRCHSHVRQAGDQERDDSRRTRTGRDAECGGALLQRRGALLSLSVVRCASLSPRANTQTCPICNKRITVLLSLARTHPTT